MFKKLFFTLFILFPSLLLSRSDIIAANTTEKVSQVTGSVTLNSDVDYVITSSTPFADDGSIDIRDSNAVIIFSSVRPSSASALLSKITINGVGASVSTNCQLRIYADGTLLLPYLEDANVLTVYTGVDCTGDSESYAAGSRRGLLNKAMNNRIVSFTLRRGYMVCFATKYDGKGYSRIFIADKENLSMNLPGILTNSISSIRVMKWNDTSKKGYAGNDATVNAALNTTWCYNWDAGTNVWADREYVTQHHHEGWPSISDVGSNGTSACAIGNNEPDNTSDDREQVNTVDEVLATWEDMMATGKRLGSPAMSSNLSGWLYPFIDSIDARGWRCDFVVMHCYWYNDWSSWYSTLNTVHSRTKRPIWITEMNYGANWTGWPGSSTDGTSENYAIEYQHMKPIHDGLESTDWIERYAIYNWVQDCRKVYADDGTLTTYGEYYANTSSNLAYNASYEYVPTSPPMKDPSDFKVSFDNSTGVVTITFHEYNGEYNTSILVERSVDSGVTWEVVGEIMPQEDEADYTYADSTAVNGSYYRVHVIDADGKDRYTRSQEASASDLSAGDIIKTESGETLYIGGNLFPNGDFDLGTLTWINGEGNEIGQPYFEVMSAGSIDGGEYLQAFSDMAASKEGSVRTPVDIKANTNYYFSASVFSNAITYNRLSLTSDGTTEDSVVVQLSLTTAWNTQAFQFNSGTYSKAVMMMRHLKAVSQIDKITLCQLFSTKEEAIADGVEKLKLRANSVCEYIGSDNVLSKELTNIVAELASGTDEETYQSLKTAIANALQAKKDIDAIDSMLVIISALEQYSLPKQDEINKAIELANTGTSAQDFITARQNLELALNQSLPYIYEEDAITRPDLDSKRGWTTVAGTYTDGEQGLSTVADKTCWSALWTDVSTTDTSMSMEIKQTVSSLTHGLYMLECQASTDHYCVSDQHAYIVTSNNDSIVSPILSKDLADIPTIASEYVWQTLVTAPVYVDDQEEITIGFTSSKTNAMNNVWREYGNTSSKGDCREGSWNATGFRLRRVPMYIATTDTSLWGVICLPGAIVANDDVKLYKIKGISKDWSKLYLKEEQTPIAGEPYIYHSLDTCTVFFTTTDEVSSAITDETNLRGNFLTSSRAREGMFVLSNGEWNVVGSDNRPTLKNWSGVLSSTSALIEIGEWSGEYLPIYGVTSTAIQMPKGEESSETRWYTIEGRKISEPNGHGIFIEVSNKGARKVIK